ncbi:hypothetical protein, partial [Amycolatopsis sp. SID8362]|uniref:hypothetical protein n=1 Tax=Amycolatopsis sp. SID8362 TaxID=2690346 RepID=UPI00142A1AC7
MGRRDDLVVLLGDFVARIRQSGDHSQAFAPSVVAVAADLEKSRREPDVEAGYVLGWLHWLQAQVLLGADREAALRAAMHLLSPAATMLGEIDFPEPLLPALAEAAQGPLTAALQEAARTGDLGLLDDVISGYRHNIGATPPDDPALARRLSFFGAAHFTRFQLTGDRADADQAVVLARRAVELGTADEDFDKYLSNLSGFLTTRYEQARDPADLDESIAAGRRAVTAAGSHGRVTEQLTNLGGALLTRFELAGAPADLAEAVAVTRRAAAAPGT